MSIGDRVKELRRSLGLTQQEFGDRIGIKRNSVALIEGGRGTSEQTIVSICREFGVRLEWLKDGSGEMFAPIQDREPLDALLQGRVLSQREKALVKSFLDLPQASRDAVLDFVESCARELSSQPAEEPDLASKIAELERQNRALMARLESLEKEEAEIGQPTKVNGSH